MSDRDQAFEQYISDEGDLITHSTPDRHSFNAGWRAALDAVSARYEASVPIKDKEVDRG